MSPLEKFYTDEFRMAPCPQVDNDRWKEYGCWSLRASVDEDAVADLPEKSLSSKVHASSNNQGEATPPEVSLCPSLSSPLPSEIYIQIEVYSCIWGNMAIVYPLNSKY